MVDILQMMIEFLRINCQLVNCYYTNPFEGIFYLILLPMVILIAFVYIIFWAVIKIPHTGIRLLIALVILIFIILQGWFNIFITLSWLWVILIIIMGIWWSIRRKGPGESVFGGGGGGGGRMPGLASPKGDEKRGNIANRFRQVTSRYDLQYNIIEKEVNLLEANGNAIIQVARNKGEFGNMWDSFRQQSREITKDLKDLGKTVETGGGFGPDLRNKHMFLVDRVDKIVENVKNQVGK